MRLSLHITFVAASLQAGAIYASDKPTQKAVAAQAEKALTPMQQIRRLLEADDRLGMRVYVKRLASSAQLPPLQAAELRYALLQISARIGFDILYTWDSRQKPASTEYGVEAWMQQADKLMLQHRFKEALPIYKRSAQDLQEVQKEGGVDALQAKILYPYVLHRLARALYGSGRPLESLEVLRWIPTHYPKFRQVLFERMWSGFKGGRVDEALGAVASQRSAYFSGYLHPEAYLVQIYVYKRLCRQEDTRQVVQEMRRFRDDLRTGRFSAEDWARSDVENSVLWNLTKHQASSPPLDIVSQQEREQERERIRSLLISAYQRDKIRWEDNLKTTLSYAQLSLHGEIHALKPVEELPSRAELFKRNLEIWPADSAEEWIDEVGSHRFVGESECKSS